MPVLYRGVMVEYHWEYIKRVAKPFLNRLMSWLLSRAGLDTGQPGHWSSQTPFKFVCLFVSFLTIMSHVKPNPTPTEEDGQRLDLVKQINIVGNFHFSFAGTQNTVPSKNKNMGNRTGILSTNIDPSLLNLLRLNSRACWASSPVTDQTCLSGFTAVKPRTICSRSLKKRKKERKANLASFWGQQGGFLHQWFLINILMCVFLGHNRLFSFWHKALLSSSMKSF